MGKIVYTPQRVFKDYEDFDKQLEELEKKLKNENEKRL